MTPLFPCAMIKRKSQFDFVFPASGGGQIYKYSGKTALKCVDAKMNHLIANIDKLHTTEMGTERIKRNCQIETDDVVQWSKVQILDETAEIERIGKNWYVTAGSYKITVNAHSYTIITAHKAKA